MALEEVADGLALADVDANGEEDLEEVGVDGGELLGVEEQSDGVLCNFDVSLTPATHSQSTVLLRSRMTLALMWNDPEARPSWIVWTENETLPRMRSLFPQ